MSAAQRAFQVHASVWFAVNALLFVIWLVTGAGFPWFLFPALGWGVGLAAHATATYTRPIGRGGDDDDELDAGPPPRQLGH